MRLSAFVAPLVATLPFTHAAYDLTLSSADSIKEVTSLLAHDMTTYYKGNETGGTPGLLPGPCASLECYYWWEAGAMFSALINYWQYTGDDSYNDMVSQALQFQRGPEANFNPPNQSKNMGVDDQDFWAFAALDAAEAGLPDVPGSPSWLALAQAVFNFQTNLWDDKVCGGGFRWQVYSFNAGYNLKNTISNGGFFQLAARLARYTGNQTYVDWADKVYDWMAGSHLLQEQNGVLYIWDNTDANNGCIDVEHHVWSYNYGTLLSGAAYLYNLTENATWATRAQHILEGAEFLFFPQTVDGSPAGSVYGGNVMTEFQCEQSGNCNNDQSSFKAYLSRWMAVTGLLVPSLQPQIRAKLATSAQAAMNQCIGGNNGRMCGRTWYSSVWDGSSGVGQQVSSHMQILSSIPTNH